MPTVINTPAELSVFARHLSNTAASIARRRQKAARFIADSSSVWKDAKYGRFRTTFDRTAKDLDRFVKLANDYAQALEEKAKQGRKYLGSR